MHPYSHISYTVPPWQKFCLNLYPISLLFSLISDFFFWTGVVWRHLVVILGSFSIPRIQECRTQRCWAERLNKTLLSDTASCINSRDKELGQRCRCSSCNLTPLHEWFMTYKLGVIYPQFLVPRVLPGLMPEHRVRHALSTLTPKLNCFPPCTLNKYFSIKSVYFKWLTCFLN